ncbi:hypothetical protein [Streptomyces roseifaciens]|uniref:hypothetical protein n=1 Tax=Streptomyces roseifaciens TaxID=1488406 RepID=UPI000717F370|nr:hypothetical protein [Streptomyces roseifaciens]
MDATPAAAHALHLRTAGMSAGDIAGRAGISVTLVRRLLQPARTPARVHHTTAEAILGLPIPSRARTPCIPGLTPADHASQWLLQLARRGWPATYLARQLGTSTFTIAEIRNRRRQHLDLQLEQMIRLLYQHLKSTTPATQGIPCRDSHRARRAATRTDALSRKDRRITAQR